MSITYFLRTYPLQIAVYLLLAGCVKTPSIVQEPTTARALPRSVPTESTGGIFQAEQYRSYFSDDVPARVGDTLTVVIQERVSSSLSEETKGNRSADLGADFDSSLSTPFYSDSPTEKKAKGSMSIHGKNDARGKGSQANTSTFTTAISVTVLEVLANGYLRIGGEKQVKINQELETIRLTGTVNPRAISSGSVISSTRLTDVRLEQITEGRHKLFTNPGWLTRFFMAISPI